MNHATYVIPYSNGDGEIVWLAKCVCNMTHAYLNVKDAQRYARFHEHVQKRGYNVLPCR